MFFSMFVFKLDISVDINIPFNKWNNILEEKFGYIKLNNCYFADVENYQHFSQFSQKLELSWHFVFLPHSFNCQFNPNFPGTELE